jgi:hypothetical protein
MMREEIALHELGNIGEVVAYLKVLLLYFSRRSEVFRLRLEPDTSCKQVRSFVLEPETRNA